jgi:hypothetical protein
MTLQDLTDLGANDDFKRDRWGRPLIEPKDGGKALPYTRSSSAAKTIEDTFNLELWMRRNIVYGMAHDTSLIARTLAIPGGPSDWDQKQKKAINDICEAAAQVAQASKAADIGTALHAMVEQVNLGHSVDAGIYAADLDAYRWAISQMGWQIHPDHVECRMVCDPLQMAGTCDMLVQNDDGEYFVADLKTSSSVDYGGLGWSAQLAAYAHSDIYSPLLNARLETPVINKQIGYIVHLPAGQGVCTIHQVDLVKGYAAAELANEIRATRAAAKKFITPVYTAEADKPPTDTPEPTPEPPQGHTEALADRMRWLIANGHGDKLQLQWPDGVPGLKTGGHTTAQIETITALVTRIENQVEAPWPSAPAKTSTRNTKVTAPAPPKPVEEGELISDDLLLELANRYADLSEKDRQTLSRVANETNAAGRSISITQRPSQRRHAITQALCDWCDFGWDDEVVNTALVQVTQKVGSIGDILSKISTHHAEAFGKLARDLTEGRVELAITLDGPTFKTKETS